MTEVELQFTEELLRMEVYGETDVGWCEATPINETMDGEGNASIQERGFAASDPRAPNKRAMDDPGVLALREYLKENNGIQDIEVCSPEEIDRAAEIFYRDGFVVVKDLLDKEHLDMWREGCARILRDILVHPGHDGRKYITETSRLPHRYSYGTASASRQLLHDPVWAAMVDLPTTTPILCKIFGSDDYSVIGAGGDLCLPGAVEYQALHSDIHENFEISAERLAQARKAGVNIGDTSDAAELNPRVRQQVIERTPPLVTINFLMSDLTWENGPIRQIPATHASAFPPPSQTDEPPWMRLSTLVGAPAGAGMFRDNRGWHGATPNLSREVRALPDVEYGSPWMPGKGRSKTMPHEIWKTLSEHGRAISELVKAEPGVWPAGAGVMHPLLRERRAANSHSPGIGGEK